MTQAITTSEYSFPQVSPALAQGVHGIATLTHKGRTFRFRTNPNQFSWTYTLNKHVDATYGGRVVQLLSTKIDDFVVEADCGAGRWPYALAIANFLRNVMVSQRDGTPSSFEYTTRGWKLNVYIVSMPFEDSVTEVLRTFTIQMKVQEDVSQVMTKNSLQAELSRLQDGIGFKRDAYNDPTIRAAKGDPAQGPGASAISAHIPGIDSINLTSVVRGYPNNTFLNPPGGQVAGVNGLPNPNPPASTQPSPPGG